MKKNIVILACALIIFSMIGCATGPLGEPIFAQKYKQRIVRVVPVTQNRTITIKVHHVGALSRSERADLKRWYKHKHHRPQHHVNIIFIRN